MQARRRAGLRSFPSGLLQDELVEREIRDSPAQPRVLGLKVLQPFDLVALEPAILLAPAVVRDLRDADGADRVGHGLPLREQDIDLAQLGDDLLRFVSLPRHCGPPFRLQSHTSAWTTSKGVDQLMHPEIVAHLECNDLRSLNEVITNEIAGIDGVSRVTLWSVMSRR
jgi:hypothetical protein